MGDWIPMEKIRNLSLKKTILLYFVISLTAAFLLSGFTVHFARNMQNKIWEKYIDYADYTDVFQQYGKKYEIEISRPNQSQMNRLDYHLSEMCDFMETYSVLIFSIVGSVAAVFFFYKNKLKTPLQELKDASQMIAPGNGRGLRVSRQQTRQESRQQHDTDIKFHISIILIS